MQSFFHAKKNTDSLEAIATGILKYLFSCPFYHYLLHSFSLSRGNTPPFLSWELWRFLKEFFPFSWRYIESADFVAIHDGIVCWTVFCMYDNGSFERNSWLWSGIGRLKILLLPFGGISRKWALKIKRTFF